MLDNMEGLPRERGGKMRMMIWLLLVQVSFFTCLRAEEPSLSPRWAIKTNLLYWTTTTPNMAVEYAFTEKISLDITASYNPFRFGKEEENKKIGHWIVRPELRLWYCEKYAGSAWGLNVHYGRFNAGGISLPGNLFPTFADYRREGTLAGAGISYSYHWLLSSSWSIEGTFGAGYSFITYDRFECGTCGRYKDHKEKHYFGLTRLGLSLVYLF